MDIHNKLEKDFLSVYETYQDAIFRHCYFRLRGNRELAKDIMQEAFTKTWIAISIRGTQIQYIRAFVYKTANNLIIDHVRKKEDASLEAMMENGFAPENHHDLRMKDNVDAGMVINVMGALDKKYREVIIMRYIDKLTPKEIGEILGETANVVSVRLHRGVKECKKLFRNIKT